ncbi:HAD-IIIA family hydrolase [Paraburkholderia fungorum]|uniref:D,D-heptose 1,7-bisphosphate phosphatase n=1 Tax=Paraburkholderia fungorum TaxID=134537 RepID=A0AAP5QFU6_9BURK|nr:HAD-IIIA family hydrolase [Paraburkholderia fungorum]MDT8843421.1 HAD-IIIA family hydrolase [Paraburkholderia fungorum]PRZ46260.1 D,D-heptose 1,7-bisphosphate phosphatase [Paraburkholderia fungorum]
MQVIILAGGRGTRLKLVTGDLPKPLVDVCGEPLLGRQLELIAATQTCREVLILTGYGAEEISRYCGDGDRWGLRVRCVAEQNARGTAGAVLDAYQLLDPAFIVMYGDTVLDVDLDRLVAAHQKAKTEATLFLHPNDHPYDSDIVTVDGDGYVRAFMPYPHAEGVDLPNLVNAGLYVLQRDALSGLDGLPDKPDFGKHVFARMLARGQKILAYKSPEYIKDAGTPDRIAKVRKDFASGRVAGMSLRKPVPAVFLDRDGVLNEERNRVSRADELVLLPGVEGAVRRLNQSAYRTVVVTNQPVVARGDCTEDELAGIHARLDTLLGAKGAFVDSLYYCPHHPDGGFPGEVAALKRICDCRKPATGMIERAKAELNLALQGSWMIGDTTTDIELARRTGIRSILVRTGHGGRDGRHEVTADFVVPALPEAVSLILDQWPILSKSSATLVDDIKEGEVVMIGGAARSGKSSFASAVSIALREKGMRAIVISLDNWLRSRDSRGPGLLGRYDMAEAECKLRALIEGRQRIVIPRYNEMTWTSTADAVQVKADRRDVIIIEGCPALISSPLTKIAQHRIFVECEEDVRYRRFVAEYERRGMTLAEIESLYSARNCDEVPLIRESAVAADRHILLKELQQ